MGKRVRLKGIDVFGGSFIPVGEHMVYIYEITEDQVNGKDVLRITFKDDEDRQIADTYWLQKNALWKLKKLALAAGFSEEELDDFDVDYLIGNRVMIRVNAETRDGKKYHNVVDVFPVKDEPANRTVKPDYFDRGEDEPIGDDSDDENLPF